MTERVWDKFLTARDKAVFAASGYGARAGFGKRPARPIVFTPRTGADAVRSVGAGDLE
jgi:hypothetical protein